MTTFLRMIHFATVILTAFGCQRDTSNAPTPQLSSVLVVADGATSVLPETQPDGQTGMTYMVREDFPADSLLAQMRAALPAPEWRPLANDWLNPDSPSSHQKGWTIFEEGTQSPATLVHQWLAQWQDSKGNIVFYVLRYDSAITVEPLYRSVPDNSNLHVNAVWIPAEVAESVQVVGASSNVEVSAAFIARPSIGAQELLLKWETGRDGKRREYRVLQSSLESTPGWSPKEEDPPLPLRQAATIASSQFKPNNPEDVEVVGFDLQAYLTEHGRRWYYVVSLYDVQDDPPYISRLIVLMDGTVIEGTIVE